MSTPLNNFKTALHEVRIGQMGAAAFCESARQNAELLDALPTRFVDVLGGLLDRLESSALFTEESCSFSQVDLLDSLLLWAEKARQELERR